MFFWRSFLGSGRDGDELEGAKLDGDWCCTVGVLGGFGGWFAGS